MTKVSPEEEPSSKSFNVERKLISLIPDLVLYDKNSGNIPHILKFDGVLLFADVSGFTALTERYTCSSAKGTDALTVTLNKYIGKIVQRILLDGGDVLKFAGDAILAVWKVKSRPELSHAITQAAKCSLIIQEKCDNQETDVGVKLRVKIAISAGKVYATFVGNENSHHFVMAGRPVREVNAAEKYCEAGLVVLSPNAMELSERDNIITEALSERFGLVKYLRHEPRKEWKEYVDIPADSEFLEFSKSADKNDRLSLRMRLHSEREAIIRKYITPVVQRKLDDDQPLKYLSEMRQCSIVFLNLAFDLNERDKMFHEKQCANMEAAFNIVFTNVQDRQGSLNKIFMFDKGCTFLVIFGLPGDKHEQEPAHALQAAWKISQDMRHQLASLTLVSSGVTTGPVFCGVIGHEERHEYTVIGQKVNLAARLMMHYPNVVSCEAETYNDSKLSKDMFTLLPYKAMKGVGHVTVYNYTEGERKPAGTTVVTEPEYPIIGREDEIELFVEELRELKASKAMGRERRVIVFEGEAGFGKTRVMKEIQWRAACERFRVISFTLSINDQSSPFFGVKILLELLLGVDYHTERNAREQALLKVVAEEDTDSLHLLNDIMSVSFPTSDEAEKIKPEARDKILHRLLVEIVQQTTSNQFVVFALDDAQNLDNESWNVITTLSKHHRALCVIAMRPFGPDKPPCNAAKQVLYHPKTLYVKLGGLLNSDLTPLACQFLKVERIPIELEKTLIERSYGVPLWCEQLIRDMQKAEVLRVVPISPPSRLALHNSSHQSSEDTREDLIRSRNVSIGNKNLITRRLTKRQWNTASVERRRAGERGHHGTKVEEERQKERPISWTSRIRWQKAASHFIKHHAPRESIPPVPVERRNTSYDYVPMECVVKANFDLRKFPVPASVRGMALARLDRMHAFEQLVVKCAAVIGGNTSCKMLKAVVPGCTDEKFKRAVYNLMHSRVFECASLENERREITNRQNMIRERMFCYVTCGCHLNEDGEEPSDEKVAARCEQLKFHNSLVQETAYNLWLSEQRRSLHEACAYFLESNLNEVLITGTTDEVVTKQFRLSAQFMKDNHHEIGRTSKMYLGERRISMSESHRHSGQSRSLHTNQSRYASTNTSTDTQVTSAGAFLGLLQSPVRKVSASGSVIGKLNVKSVGSTKSDSQPLILQLLPHTQDEVMPDKQQKISVPDDVAVRVAQASQVNKTKHFGEIAKALGIKSQVEKHNMISGKLNEDMTMRTTSRRLSYGLLWTRSAGMSPNYDEILSETEELARHLTNLTVNKQLRTPFEIHETLTLIYTHLVSHWKKALNTSKTIQYLLKAAESANASLALTTALRFLQNASEIVENLDKGLDIISNFTEKDDMNVDDVKVLSVNRKSKARIQSLLGEIFFQQGKMDKSLQHFLKALKLLRCWLPSNRICVWSKTWVESRRQAAHSMQPRQYIGTASSKVANRSIEQVRCLSYIWPILLTIKTIHNRIKLSKLVALMQVNRAEAADDDLQELITAYTYMMQINQLDGDLSASVFYESKATARCLEMPHKLTASDLCVIGHLHLPDVKHEPNRHQNSMFDAKHFKTDCILFASKVVTVSCSVRLCGGKLVHATASGYRAYNMADSLGDIDVKLLVLPLISQIHILTRKGRACIEVLTLLASISKLHGDDVGLAFYYASCFDLILEGCFHVEKTADCLDHIQNLETGEIGDIPRLYLRSLMAVWCYRRNETSSGKNWLKIASDQITKQMDSFMAVRAFTRIVETRLLALKKSLDRYGLKHRETRRSLSICKKSYHRLRKLCKSFPVFIPRSLHLHAYYHMLNGNRSRARELITNSINTAKFCGNVVDQQWAEHSQKVWFEVLTPDEIVTGWNEQCMELPDCDTSNKDGHRDLKFSFLMADRAV